MATITMPTSPSFNQMKPLYRRNTALSISPYNYTQQIYSWGGKLKVVEFSLPPMKQDEAINWITFFNSLNGLENTFNVDLTIAYPNESGSVGAVPMRLIESDLNWDISTAKHYGFSFTAMEAK